MNRKTFIKSLLCMPLMVKKLPTLEIKQEEITKHPNPENIVFYDSPVTSTGGPLYIYDEVTRQTIVANPR